MPWLVKVQSLLRSGLLDARVREAFEKFEGLPRLTHNQLAWVDREHARMLMHEEHLALIEQVVDHPDATDREREAFSDMGSRPLSAAQAGWLVGVADRLGIGGAQNLYSAGLVPEGPIGPGGPTKLPHEREGYVKPTRPPGRR